MIRSNAIIAAAIFLCAGIVWFLQSRTITDLRESVEHSRATIANRQPAEPEHSTRRLTALPRTGSGRRSDGRPAAGNAEATGRQAPEPAEVASIDNAWGAMARALELNVSQTELLEAPGRRYLEEQGRIDTALIESAAAVLAGEGREAGLDRLDETLRQRHELANGTVVAEIRKQLNLIGQAQFAVFKKQEENSLLQILADQEFAAWRRFLVVTADQEDDLYRIVHESWTERIKSPPPQESPSAAELEARLGGERSRLLTRVEEILSESQLDLLRVTLEESHQRMLRGRD